MRGAQDLVFPPHALDGSGRTFTAGLTAEAWSKIRFIAEPLCEGCGAPFDYDRGPGVLCPACLSRRPAFDRARAACLYDEASRDLILKLKHADRTDLTGLLARWVARGAAEVLAEADAVLPVPLHRWRLLRRRYNQAAEIARPLARLSGVAYWPDPLVRRRATASQAGRSGDGRRRNVAAAFEVSPRWRSRIAGKRLVLVDDVLTTGATAEACARALKRAGAKEVHVLALARVVKASQMPI